MNEVWKQGAPRPWRADIDEEVVTLGECVIVSASDPPEVVASGVSKSDAVLIEKAINEYEALVTLEANMRALVGMLVGPYRHHADEALHDLDTIRSAAR